jgi:hypothetical protein
MASLERSDEWWISFGLLVVTVMGDVEQVEGARRGEGVTQGLAHYVTFTDH